jgi:L-lactate dehydrogenase complex protein LldG
MSPRVTRAAKNTSDADALLERFTRRVRGLSGSVWLAPGGRDEVRQALRTAITELTDDRPDVPVKRIVAWATDELATLDLPGLVSELGMRYVPWAPQADETAQGARARLRETSADGVLGITTCAWASAETGTVALYATPATGRLPSLVPPAHLCLVRPGQIVQGIPEGLRLISDYLAKHHELPSTINLVSGPSRSADIEGDISIGVHGPVRQGVIVGDW